VSPALTLWSLPDVIDSADRRARLYRLLRQIEIADEPPATVILPKRVASLSR
jgi:hypothetical protein